MHFRKLSNKDWRIIEERFERKLSSWKGKLLSMGGQLVLINSVLTSLPMFMMCFFELPKGVLKKLDYYRSHFVFGKMINIKKIQIGEMESSMSTKTTGWSRNSKPGNTKHVLAK